MMEIFEAVRARRAIRDYQVRARTRELIEQVIADAVQAPNSINRQAWGFTVVQGASQLAAISDEAKAFALASTSTGAPTGPRDVLRNPRFPHLLQRSGSDRHRRHPAGSDGRPGLLPRGSEPDAVRARARARNLLDWLRGGWLNTSDGRCRLNIPENPTVVAPIIIVYPEETPKPPVRRTPAIT
jgi:nitroreductase